MTQKQIRKKKKTIEIVIKRVNKAYEKAIKSSNEYADSLLEELRKICKHPDLNIDCGGSGTVEDCSDCGYRNIY